MNKEICPKCKSDNVVPIMYGYPTTKMKEEESEGKIVLLESEASVGSTQQDRHCKDCNYRWSIESFLATDIKKVRFRYYSNWGYIDPEGKEEAQWAYDIYKDGRIEYHSYPRMSRKVISKKSFKINELEVQKFYENLLNIKEAGEMYVINDGCSYSLTLTYRDKRKKVLFGDVCEGIIDKLVFDFLKQVPGIEELMN